MNYFIYTSHQTYVSCCVTTIGSKITKVFYGIATDLIKKNNDNFCLKVNLTSFHVAFLVFYLHFSPISADLDDLPWIETVPVSSMG